MWIKGIFVALVVQVVKGSFEIKTIGADYLHNLAKQEIGDKILSKELHTLSHTLYKELHHEKTGLLALSRTISKEIDHERKWGSFTGGFNSEYIRLELKTRAEKLNAICKKVVNGLLKKMDRQPAGYETNVCGSILLLASTYFDYRLVPDPDTLLDLVIVLLYRNEGKDCENLLICQSIRNSAQRYFLNRILSFLGEPLKFLSNFLSYFDLSFLSPMMPWNWSKDCLELYPKCPITL